MSALFEPARLQNFVHCGLASHEACLPPRAVVTPPTRNGKLSFCTQPLPRRRTRGSCHATHGAVQFNDDCLLVSGVDWPVAPSAAS